jgi:hypothetical protein
VTSDDPPNRFVDEQRAANQSTLACFAEYQEHRERMTRLLVEGIPTGSALRICVLGAGNAYDLELAKLAEHFSEIHLVDVDREALESAEARQPEEIKGKLVLHAPEDLTGFLGKLDAWSRMEVTEQEMLTHPVRTSKELAQRLGTFDLVVSACVITQMQLSALTALGDAHRLFDAVRHTLALTHLHTLFELTAPGGRALLVTDVLSNQNYRYLDKLPADANFMQVLTDVIAAERVIYVARPGLFHLLARQDPVLGKRATLSPPLAAWLWRNGPESRFLVYAMALTHKA